MSRAVRLCPELVIVRPTSRSTRGVAQVFEIFRGVTPLVEPLSLDEAYLDVTENAWGEPLGVEVARRLKTRILEETRLTASAGVAPNKFLAKIASGWKKPDGLTVISPDRIERFLQELPVDALWGSRPEDRRAAARRGDRAARRRAHGARGGAAVRGRELVRGAAPPRARRGRPRRRAEPRAQVGRLGGDVREGHRGDRARPRGGRGARRAHGRIMERKKLRRGRSC
jgi:hypothetical protein